jgi:hypothetical protein
LNPCALTSLVEPNVYALWLITLKSFFEELSLLCSVKELLGLVEEEDRDTSVVSLAAKRNVRPVPRYANIGAAYFLGETPRVIFQVLELRQGRIPFSALLCCLSSFENY